MSEHQLKFILILYTYVITNPITLLDILERDLVGTNNGHYELILYDGIFCLIFNAVDIKFRIVLNIA